MAPHILVDSSIWIDHLNGSASELPFLLRRRRALMHPMVAGEVALGSLRDRAVWIAEAEELPAAPVASHREMLALIEWGKLFGCGIGYVDAHLLASVRLVENGRLWTRDKRLQAEAERLDVA